MLEPSLSNKMKPLPGEATAELATGKAFQGENSGADTFVGRVTLPGIGRLFSAHVQLGLGAGLAGCLPGRIRSAGRPTLGPDRSFLLESS